MCVCVVWWWWCGSGVCVCVCVCVCIQYVCIKCMCSVRVLVCVHTRVCVMCVWFIFYWYNFLYMYVFTFFSFFNVCIWVDILCIYVYAGCHEFILFFSSFFVSLYMHVRALSFFFLSVYTPLTSYLIHISYVLNMFGFFVYFYIFWSLCMCIISRIAIVPHGRGLDVKRPRV